MEGLSRKNLRSALSTLDPAAGGIILALGSLGKAWDLQDREADAIEERMKRVLEANAPALLTIYGCGTVSAAALTVAGGESRKAEKRGRVRLPMRRRPAAGELGQNGTPSPEQRGRQARQQGALPDRGDQDVV